MGPQRPRSSQYGMIWWKDDSRRNRQLGVIRRDRLSNPPSMRRAEQQMSADRAIELLASEYCGRLATVGPDGAPYICPLLYVMLHGQVWLHNTSALGHLQRNILHEPRVCFEIDVPGETFPYGRFQCD